MSGPILLILRILLALGLYAFLALSLSLLWREIRLQGSLISNRKVPSISLKIQSEETVQTLHFNKPEITIGRDPACECPLIDAAVSARHARLVYHHGQWWLEDLDSTNGTLINAEKLITPVVVISGDEFKCGNTTLIISLPENA